MADLDAKDAALPTKIVGDDETYCADVHDYDGTRRLEVNSPGDDIDMLQDIDQRQADAQHGQLATLTTRKIKERYFRLIAHHSISGSLTVSRLAC